MLRPLNPVKEIDVGELQWVPMTANDELPFGAVVGGFENGEVLYIARATHNFSICPGKYVPSAKRAFVAWGHRSHKKDIFEILCGFNLAWVKTRRSILPPNAFAAGTAVETNNETLYIGRALIENKNLIPGKVHLHYKTCYIPYKGLEKEVHAFEILVTPNGITPLQIVTERNLFRIYIQRTDSDSED